MKVKIGRNVQKSKQSEPDHVKCGNFAPTYKYQISHIRESAVPTFEALFCIGIDKVDISLFTLLRSLDRARRETPKNEFFFDLTVCGHVSSLHSVTVLF